MTHTSASPLLIAFAAEHAALLPFVQLLEREQEMLVENHTDSLLILSEKKSADALRLSKLSQASHALLQKYIPQPSASSIHAWLSIHSQDGLLLWQKIVALAQRCQQLNHANGELIQMRLRHNQQTLTVLNNAVNKANLYGPDGQTNFQSGNGRTLGLG